MKAKKYNGQSSKARLQGNLASILERPVGDFDPDEISWITPRIGITDFEGSREAQFNDCFVINVAEELMGNIYDNVDIPFEGDRINLHAQMNKFADLVDGKLSEHPDNKVVVHCAMGMERAPLAVVGYLMKYEHLTVDEAYELIVSKRPIVCDRRIWMEKGMWAW